MHKDILDRFHSYTDLAHHIGVSPKTVWNWTKKGIPPKRFKDVVKAAKTCHVKGVTVDALYKMMNT
jgi:DNA-binding XRE family transcriptional regulator